MDLATDMACEVDGQPIYNLAAYRVAGDPFAIQMPDGNIWQFFGCDTGPGPYFPLVPDGVYLMLAPSPIPSTSPSTSLTSPAGVPAPAHASTWGRIKATYR